MAWETAPRVCCQQRHNLYVNATNHTCSPLPERRQGNILNFFFAIAIHGMGHCTRGMFPVCHQNQITNSEVRLRTQLFLSLLECRQALFRLSVPKFVCEKMNIFHLTLNLSDSSNTTGQKDGCLRVWRKRF